MSTMTAENILTLIEQLPSTERVRLNKLLARRQTLLEAEPAQGQTATR
jgi:hypothetical protein